MQDLSGMTLLHYACLLHYVGSGQWLLTRMPQPTLNLQDMNGCTPLHWAAHSGAHAVVETLLQHNSSPLVLDLLGNSPSDYARREGHLKLASLLVSTTTSAAATAVVASMRPSSAHSSLRPSALSIILLQPAGRSPSAVPQSPISALHTARRPYERLRIIPPHVDLLPQTTRIP